MRYRINYNKTINQLIPHYWGGRNLILYLQALIKPLQQLNDAFVKYTNETRIEMAMTSQPIMFEWYLNRQLKKYFKDGNGKISIIPNDVVGVPIYLEDANIPQTDHLLLSMQEEGTDTVILRHSNESTGTSNYSFIVSTPKCDTQLLTEEQYITMLKYYVDKYRIANKTYKIQFN